MITKALKEVHKQLGNKYEIMMVDFEECITRKYDEHYFLEVSGLNRNKKVMSCTIFLWCDGLSTIVKSHISSIDELKDLLQNIEADPRGVFIKSLIRGAKQQGRCGECSFLGLKDTCCYECSLYMDCEYSCKPFECNVDRFFKSEKEEINHETN